MKFKTLPTNYHNISFGLSGHWSLFTGLPKLDTRQGTLNLNSAWTTEKKQTDINDISKKHKTPMHYIQLDFSSISTI